MPRPVCVECKREMNHESSGVAVGIQAHSSHRPDKLYQVWFADQFRCGGCGSTLLARFATKPVWNQFDEEEPPVCEIMVPER